MRRGGGRQKDLPLAGKGKRKLCRPQGLPNPRQFLCGEICGNNAASATLKRRSRVSREKMLLPFACMPPRALLAYFRSRVDDGTGVLIRKRDRASPKFWMNASD